MIYMSRKDYSNHSYIHVSVLNSFFQLRNQTRLLFNLENFQTGLKILKQGKIEPQYIHLLHSK